MATIPGLRADVFYGDAEKHLPSWRESVSDSQDSQDESEDDDTPTDDELQAVSSILGFNPLEDADAQDTSGDDKGDDKGKGKGEDKGEDQ